MTFVPPKGPVPARVAIIGEAPGEQEIYKREPFAGSFELDKLLHEAGFLRSECFVTNVFKTRPPKDDIRSFFDRRAKCPGPGWSKYRDSWLLDSVASQLDLLDREIEECRPDLVIAFGNMPLWFLTGKWGVTDWRGSTMTPSGRSFVVVPTYHPTAILRQYSWRPYVLTDLKRAHGVLRSGLVVPRYNFILRPQFDQVLSHLAAFQRMLETGPLHLSVDVETRGWKHIDCIGIAWSKHDAICIPLMCRDRPVGYWSLDEEYTIISTIREILCHPNVRVSGQNFSYDTQQIHRSWGFHARLGFDTMVGHHVLFPGTDKDLATLSSLYCDYHSFWKHESQEADAKADDYGRWVYNCRDCVATYEIAENLCRLIEKEGLREPCIEQHSTWWDALDAMGRGVKTNAPEKKRLSGNLLLEITSREEWINFVCAHPLNVRSPKQLQALFYDDFKLPVIRVRGKDGYRPSCNEEALTQLAVKFPIVRPLIAKILEIRSLNVFRSTFLEANLDRDGRIRCSYNVAGPKTFRLSSSANAFGNGLNLQNIPDGNKDWNLDDIQLDLPNIRNLFVFDDGKEGFDMDLSQADLRIVVEESDEADLRALLAAGLNPYLELAREFYHDGRIVKGNPAYTTFKSLAHGTNYLGTARGLAKRLGLGVAETERVQRWYLGRFPRIAKWQNDVKRRIELTRHIKNAFGYRIYFFDRIDSQVFNAAAAWVPQSTVGLLINRIWKRINAELPGCDILLQVHDSLVGQYPAAQRDYYRARLAEISRVPIPYPTPLIIPTGFKTSTTTWGACK